MTAFSPPAILGGMIAGAGLLWLFDAWLDPVPVSALFALLPGLAIALGLHGRFRYPFLSFATVAGAVAGSILHRHWHLSGRSPSPAGSLFDHLAFEGLIGMLVALICLAPLLWITRQRR